MKRKVIAHGPATLIISLPSKWTKRYNVQKGDELDVEQFGSMLTVRNHSTVDSKKIIDITDLDPLVKRTIIKCYQSGYNELDIKFGNPCLVKKIHEVTSEQLIGYEIVSQNNNQCIIKEIASFTDDKFDMLYRRIFLLLKEILKDGQRALEQNDLAVLRSIKFRDLEINRLTNFCIRKLNKQSIGNSNSIFLKVYQLERAADEYKLMIETVLNQNIRISKNFIKLHEEMLAFFDKVYSFTFDYTRQKAIAVAKNLERIKKLLENAIEKQMSKEIKALFFLRSIVNIIATVQEVDLSEIKDIQDVKSKVGG